MKKAVKNNIIAPVNNLCTERKNILTSMVASFRIEGIYIPEARVEAIYTKVNEKLRK